jgi:hypothetical protein
MTDPIRWSDSDDPANAAERMLMRSGQDLAMPDAEKQAVWNQILGALPPVGPVAAAKAAILASRGSLLALKVLCALGVAAGLAVGTHYWLSRAPVLAPSAPSLPATASASAMATASATATPTLDTTSHATQARDVTPAPSPSMAPSRASQLREESIAVMAARQALRENDAGKALRLLEQAQLRFKKGVLAEEREALTIEALAKSGQKARASARAAAFLHNYPRSPHAADVQPFVAK